MQPRAMAASATLAAALALSTPSIGQTLSSVRVSTINTGVFATHAPGDASRLFIVSQGGRIDILNLPADTVRPTPFLASVPSLVSGGEAGLLGLAFDPQYDTNGYFYIYATRSGGTIGPATRMVSRFGSGSV